MTPHEQAAGYIAKLLTHEADDDIEDLLEVFRDLAREEWGVVEIIVGMLAGLLQGELTHAFPDHFDRLEQIAKYVQQIREHTPT